ncbi:hypothetical protein HPB51_023934 [Rhipicephalus microplus]|uniref:Septin-type G domain-containing protein n=1 Tax=Rhipicephalus microplus TaxID=6941 RepID=A0A9J6DDI7_RHIMP|nr:hypothetical protein HPB51_023934 [Rhipicephalus microplus]
MPALPRRSASSGAADVPTARLGYRYAGLERFSGRPRVYESPSSSRSSSPPPLPEKQPPPLPPQPPSFTALTLTSSLSTKRELFFRDGPAPPAAPGGLLGLSKDSTGSLSSSGGGTAPPSYASSSTAGSREVAEGYVGFASLPNQVYRKAVKKGFEFTLMVVGEAGLGKSTLINSMFLTDIYSNEYPGPSHRVKKTVEVETTRVLLKEGSVNLTLTIVDTPGFGDAVDNTQCWQPIIDYIEAKYAEYLDAESRVHRTTLPDNRVHCCLYFIAPSGHGLKPLDIEFMKRLHDKVNIIPVIAKADTMTPEECSLFKRTILNEITQNKIRLYEFPDPEDEEESKLQKPLKAKLEANEYGSLVGGQIFCKKLLLSLVGSGSRASLLSGIAARRRGVLTPPGKAGADRSVSCCVRQAIGPPSKVDVSLRLRLLCLGRVLGGCRLLSSDSLGLRLCTAACHTWHN